MVGDALTPEHLIESSPRYKLLWEAWEASRLGTETDFPSSSSGDRFLEWVKNHAWRTVSDNANTSALDVLTFRQREVADLLVLGEDHHEIAAAIGIDAHRLNLLKRLGVKNNVELVRLALGAPVGGRP